MDKTSKKHYHIIDDHLILNDAIWIKHVTSYLTILLSSIIFVMNLQGGWDAFDLILLFFIVCAFVVLIWSFFKKDYRRKIPLSEIEKMVQTGLAGDVYYLKLQNGRQRNLNKVRSVQQAMTISDHLREAGVDIEVNFSCPDNVEGKVN